MRALGQGQMIVAMGMITRVNKPALRQRVRETMLVDAPSLTIFRFVIGRVGKAVDEVRSRCSAHTLTVSSSMSELLNE